MYETTTPPQKALNIYSQAPWLLICLLFFASPLLGQSCPQPSDPEWLELQQTIGTNPGDNHGASIAMNGELMVVGSPEDSSLLSAAGSAKVFRLVNGTWQLEQQLQAPSPLSAERFGNSVDVYDDGSGGGLVVISTRPVSLGTGLVINVYVFRMDTSQSSTWNLDTVLTPPSEPMGSGSPGSSVAVDKNYIAVGVPFGDSTFGSSLAGVVRVFEFGELVAGQWSESPSAPLQYVYSGVGLFGSWVDIQISDTPGQGADLIVVGAPASNGHGSNFGLITGRAFVLERVGYSPTPSTFYTNHWEIVDELNPIDGPLDSYKFGASVAISNDVIVVGAHQYSIGPGNAHVFRLDNSTTDFSPEQILVASDGVHGDIFGRSVAISGDTIVVGAFGDTSPTLPFTPEWGAAYVYRHVLSNPPNSVWTDERKLAPLNLQQGDRFGVAVAISDCHIGVGTSRDDDNGTNSGSAFVFQNADCNPCVEVEDVTLQVIIGEEDQSIAPCTSLAQISMTNLSDFLMIGVGVSIVHPFGLPPGVPYPAGYGGPSVPQGFLPLNTPVANGGLIPLSVPISGAVGGSCVCLEIVLHADNGSEYFELCTQTICVEIPLQVGCGDCNDNGVPDDIDILIGESEDCDADGMPDDCLFIDCNGNLIPDSCDIVSGFSLDVSGPLCVPDGIPDECQTNPCKTYIVGDSNGDGQQNVADVITLLSYLFSNGSIQCRAAGDFNDDELLDVSDVIALLNFIFAGGTPPPTGTDCTADLTPSDLSEDCEDSSCN